MRITKLSVIFFSWTAIALHSPPLYGQVSPASENKIQNLASNDTLEVKVDGHLVSMFVSGKGNYTIVLEAGGASNHQCWKAVDTTLAKFARVISYDRPGYLRSEICDKPRDAITIAQELKQALDLTGNKPPYILVGWSMGGSFARVFCGLYPETVAGLVLIDPAPEEIYPRAFKEFPELMVDDSAYLKELMASDNRPGERAEILVFDSSMNQARNSDKAHSTPTTLLISPYGKAPGKFVNDPNNTLNRAWVEEQLKWAATRPNLRYKIVENSGHHIAKERPDAVINAIKEIISY
jgi:pimeloyl-ACP methyl ester carboxylesterase